jgi:hypothetical protein
MIRRERKGFGEPEAEVGGGLEAPCNLALHKSEVSMNKFEES